MEYKELRTLEKAVNTKGSKFWIKMNDNSKAAKHRQLFVQQNGGFFKLEGRYWVWVCPEDEQNGYWLININTNEKQFFSNMSEWAEAHGMTAVKVCELLNGKRKTYKGWTAVEVREVRETVGSHPDIKKKPPQKVAIYKSAVLQHKETGEIFNVDNIPEFAKIHNLNKKELYKVVRGASKSYNNFKLYNPFEILPNSNSDK